jgi:hypothetical protein
MALRVAPSPNVVADCAAVRPGARARGGAAGCLERGDEGVGGVRGVVRVGGLRGVEEELPAHPDVVGPHACRGRMHGEGDAMMDL